MSGIMSGIGDAYDLGVFGYSLSGLSNGDMFTPTYILPRIYPLFFIIRIIISMDNNTTCDDIVRLEGDCFKESICSDCPFKYKCLYKMIHFGKSITKEVRLRWALDKIIQEQILNDYSEEEK